MDTAAASEQLNCSLPVLIVAAFTFAVGLPDSTIREPGWAIGTTLSSKVQCKSGAFAVCLIIWPSEHLAVMLLLLLLLFFDQFYFDWPPIQTREQQETRAIERTRVELSKRLHKHLDIWIGIARLVCAFREFYCLSCSCSCSFLSPVLYVESEWESIGQSVNRSSRGCK